MRYSNIPIAKAKKPSIDDIEAMADQLVPGLSRSIAKVLQQTSDAVDLDDLAAALESGDLNAVFTILDKIAATQTGAVTGALQDAVWAAGTAAAAKFVRPSLNGIVFEFDRLNPQLVTWLQTYSLGLIKQIDDTTKEAVRDALVNGMKAGQNPRVQAKAIKQIIGLTPKQSQAVANYRKELETFHARRSAKGWGIGQKIDRVNGHQVFKPDEDGDPKDGILERRLRDFRFDGQLSSAMKTGKPLTPQQIDKMVEGYARKYRKYRAETIARTESIRTLNMGVQESWRQAVVTGKVDEQLLRRYWKVAKDERTCPVCNSIPKLNVKGVRLGEPFITSKGTVFLAPVHPSCRCHVWIKMHEPEELGLVHKHHNRPPYAFRL